ncbi:MAG: hypothetical protein HY657_01285 [Acidobacteria bacterium]|nr:hypothetical protein [Acidobacteriota bacterium]
MTVRRKIAALVLGVAALAAALVAYRPDLVGLATPASDAAPSAALLTRQPSTYKVDSQEFYLIPTQRMEYKYQLQQGATMVFTWTAEFPVYYDMHNVPEGKPLTASERIEEGETAEAHGVYTAPYPGLHGWYWENRGDDGVLIALKTAGFYTGAVMISEGEVIPMEIQDPPPPEPLQ